MTSKAKKLLERMRNSSANWKRNDIVSLLEGYGFEIRRGGNHDVFTHPETSRLRFVLPRHRKLKKNYVRDAVKIVDIVIELRNTNDKSDDSQKF